MIYVLILLNLIIQNNTLHLKWKKIEEFDARRLELKSIYSALLRANMVRLICIVSFLALWFATSYQFNKFTNQCNKDIKHLPFLQQNKKLFKQTANKIIQVDHFVWTHLHIAGNLPYGDNIIFTVLVNTLLKKLLLKR